MTTVPTPVPHHRPPRVLHAAVVAVLVVASAVATLLLAHEWGTRWSGTETVRGSGAPATDARTVPAFTALDAAGDTAVTIQVGDEQAVVVTADDNLIDRVTTNVEGQTLVLGTRGSFTTELPMRVEVTVPTLDAVMLTGTGLVTVENVAAERFSVRVPGDGLVVAAGTAETLDVELSGTGDLRLLDLVARDVSAKLSGTGRLEVHANRSLAATVSGTGTIAYGGNPPHVSQRVTGTGAITRTTP